MNCIHCGEPLSNHGSLGSCLKAGFFGNQFTPEVEPPEKMYLVCGTCGETFDSIDTAVAHEGVPSGIDGILTCDDTDYSIKPESEAL